METIPAAVKILTTFALTLVLARLRIHLGLALLLSGFFLNLWAGIPAADSFLNIGRAFLAPSLWLLLVMMALIMEVARFMTEGGNADEIMSAVNRWGGKHGAVYALIGPPAVMGLVPMPAGAAFSAPFVEKAGGNLEVSQGWKTAVNYWFRHIAEYWWPLYPGVILAWSLFRMVPAWQYFTVMSLFSVVTVFVGYLVLIRPQRNRLDGNAAPLSGSNRRFLFIMTPMAVVVASSMLFSGPISRVMPGLDIESVKLLAVIAGLVIAAGIVFADNIRTGKRGMFSAVFARRTLSIQMSLLGVLVFRAMIGFAGLMPIAAQELAGSGIPPELIIALLPFIAGLVTGLSFAFIGASFPLIIELVARNGAGISPLSVLVLGYGFGYMGMMLSPIHLCLVVTKDYFSAGLKSIYRAVMPCVAGMLVFSIAYHTFFRLLGW